LNKGVFERPDDDLVSQ